ncbi:Frataxin like protein, mitochondrial [Astathelohania contejeani]|uniref:Frataxin like protein, mitochondrial n=1 Tax=Astathelohania contejeani TaxID=164912 RepID=A0ABQ7HZP6_9MICR|nr:Frataxin like protein, mitochondrial [Thelohania contejeani]
MNNLPMKEYNEKSLAIFNKIFEIFDSIPKGDLNYTNDIISYKLDDKNEYVINRQPAAQQIWVSSPISGPKRYYLNKNSWLNTKTNEPLLDFIRKDIKNAIGNNFK